MSQYSKEEIEEFRKKDRRISKAGVVQALISSGKFSREEIEMGVPTKYTQIYLDWIWEDKKDEVKPIEVNVAEPQTWKVIAQSCGMPVPTKEQEMTLNKIVSQYKTEKLDCGKLLQQIITRFKKYPTQERSVQTVVENIPLETLL